MTQLFSDLDFMFISKFNVNKRVNINPNHVFALHDLFYHTAHHNIHCASLQSRHLFANSRRKLIEHNLLTSIANDDADRTCHKFQHLSTLQGNYAECFMEFQQFSFARNR